MLGTRMKNIFLLIFVLCFYIFSDSYFAFTLMIITLLLVILSLFSVLFTKGKVSFSMETSGAVNKKETGFIYVEVKNNSLIPIPKMKITLQLNNQLIGIEEKKEIVFSLNGKSVEKFPVDIESRYCGNINVQIENIIIYDLLGLFSIKNEVNVENDLYILPSDFPILIESEEHRLETTEDALQFALKKGLLGQDVMDIKQYSPEEDVRHIHWNMSSKFDELMIKEFTELTDHSYLILFDRNTVTAENQAHFAIKDAMMDALVSVSKGLLEENHQHSIGWLEDSADEIQIENIHSTDELTVKLRTLLKLGAINNIKPTIVSYLEQRDNLLFSHIIYITSQETAQYYELLSLPENITILNCTIATEGETEMNEVNFTPENMDHELSQLTI